MTANWIQTYTGWGIPIVRADDSRESPTIFFEKVSHARKFRDFLAVQLKGMPSIKASTLNGKRKKKNAATS